MTSSTAQPQAPPFPPWGDLQSWEEINRRLAEEVRRSCSVSTKLRQRSAQLREDFRKLSALMTSASSVCCRQCPSICCMHAKPYYDFRDLVYLHLCSLEPPAQQPITAKDDNCRYLGSAGCVLSRELRPWICTWYICPEMHSFLGAEISIYEVLSTSIKQQRIGLEELFIENILK